MEMDTKLEWKMEVVRREKIRYAEDEGHKEKKHGRMED